MVRKKGYKMVEKQTWFLISYCSAFLFVYMLATAYTIIPSVLGIEYPVTNEFVASYNTTTSGLTGLNTLGSWMPLFAIIILTVLISSIALSYFSMGRAM